jgi:hypothetical protein
MESTPWYKSKKLISITAGLSLMSSLGGWEVFHWGYHKARTHMRVEADRYIDSSITAKLSIKSTSFRGEISEELTDRGHDIPPNKIPKAFADAYIWTDSLKEFDKYLKPILAFEYQFQSVGLFRRVTDNSMWYRAPDGELYRAYSINEGDYKGYFTYVDKNGISKYIFEN